MTPTPSTTPPGLHDDDHSDEHRIIDDLAYFGHFLHMHAGGRGGKQFILVTLLKNDGHMTQRELAKHTDLTSAALSEVLRKLEAERLIARTRSVSDRRQLELWLTPQGTQLARQYSHNRKAFRDMAFEDLTPQERRNLADTLDCLREHWAHMESKDVERRVVAR